MFVSLLVRRQKLLLRARAKAKQEPTPSTDGGALQVRLEHTKRLCPAELIEPIDL